MTVLLLAEHDTAAIADATLRALAAARQIGSEVHVLVAGSGAGAVADAAARLDGVARVLLADSENYDQMLAEPVAALLASLADGYDAIVAASTAVGKSVMPRVAALLDVMQVSDVVAVDGPKTFKRPIYAGNAIQTVTSSDATIVATIRTAGFQAAGEGGSAVVEAVSGPEPAALSEFVENFTVTSDRPELTSARVVVSGGRALGSAEAFERLLTPLADALGAAIGASRAAVDAGYAPNTCQVGQTGKIVAPDLYIAAGISGAIQHLAGMKDAKVIVAINSDADAPIFQLADFGLVADIFTALPELTAALEARAR
ncbi:MAG: electron transfer flavoprotein subunit alpha/FixB family protein [Devosia nanyangense]|uniref:Electron transfer flavoprotein subunit alpha n=1 Tax=Devosia nanyangense TaxID=1228055 RepID=A0A933NXV1_9HYPH|nr:electron transfer flavoprotein subunit alpha/FixB family protein [Devosia nanyangense]